MVTGLFINHKSYRVPLCTTEGALVASTQRGAKAIKTSGGCHATIYKRGMTRAPVVRMPSARRAFELKVTLAPLIEI